MNLELQRVGVPQAGRRAYVAALTLRAPQTVSRWLAATNPGLPDLESFRRLCIGLHCSSDSLLSLAGVAAVDEASDADAVETGWARHIFQRMRDESAQCYVTRMRGDEMEPTIRDGDAVFVDSGAQRILGNGIYALQFSGRIVVRRVEASLGVGLTIKCDKPGYRDQVVEDDAAAALLGLRVLGKVLGVAGVMRF